MLKPRTSWYWKDFSYDDNLLKAMDSKELSNYLISSAKDFFDTEQDWADISKKGFKNHIVPFFYIDFLFNVHYRLKGKP